ncbi:TIGR01777 family protein [Solimonas sp. K1W22B-7]|uniref:TIGR01777 family oxidoreductase n=1 Tax=Solimonas sp. K1W22B-7 TaxID=2303331 RepID=UPI000E337D9B|nr:TIGR01777 family oxidoreductase [Solimonas sp. K1W22B-7]AXQ30136.1 TIGR01777 family protein [Solimonas sp. K1W22B-7]
MTTVLILFCIQCLLGAFDNLWHHELEAGLSRQPQARTELALHTLRELLYAPIFVGIAWWSWQGAWAWLLIALLATEMVVTITDFVVEDRTRRLPPMERVLHTVLAMNYGALLALWAPILQQWTRLPTAMTAVDHGPWSWALGVFGAGVLGWGLYDLFAVARLGVPQWLREPLRVEPNEAPRTLLVTGATGFIGRALVRRLLQRGERIIVLSRDPLRAEYLFGPRVEALGSLAAIDAERRIDAIVNLAGEPVAGGLWTRARRERLLQSRIAVTTEVTMLIRRLRHKPAVLVNASAIGWYGERGDTALGEDSGAGEGFLSMLCRRWEEAAWAATREGVRVCRLRIGLVLGRGGGVLQPLALATRLAGGTVLGDGRHWMSWIHLQDLLRIIDLALEDEDLHGGINAVAPQPLPQAAFAAALAGSLRRPLPWRVPAWLLRLMAGEMADLFLVSQRVEPRRLLAAGFRHELGGIDAALDQILHQALPAPVAARVWVNQRCPVCRTTMGLQQATAQRGGVDLAFCPVEADRELAAWGLQREQLRRRLYVQTRDGRLLSGIDAFAAIWAALPRRRWIATLMRLPLLYPISCMVYDLAVAPLLSGWDERRARRRELAQLR